MSREAQGDRHRRRPAHANGVVLDAHGGGDAIESVGARIRCTRLVRVQIFDIESENRQPPRTMRVVSDRDARNCRFTAADHIPPWRREMNEIAQ